MAVRTINEKFPDKAIVRIMNDIKRFRLLLNLGALETLSRNRRYNPGYSQSIVNLSFIFL